MASSNHNTVNTVYYMDGDGDAEIPYMNGQEIPPGTACLLPFAVDSNGKDLVQAGFNLFGQKSPHPNNLRFLVTTVLSVCAQCHRYLGNEGDCEVDPKTAALVTKVQNYDQRQEAAARAATTSSSSTGHHGNGKQSTQRHAKQRRYINDRRRS
ncbi:hypothetical protein FWH58_02770 [Candidatus Saccharibacteria bacterium]|nr:hypothetical protein [Candidatus Saccharibacteria bacterium]